jgi:3-phenylpropionate/trans-cinnamate dioxygenase ferredoxin reductase subunit
VRTAEEIRRRGYNDELVLIGKEQHFPPYDRPPLSKEILSGKWALEQARLTIYEDLRAEILLGRTAVELNMGTKQIQLDDGSVVGFDGLVIATGTTPRRLPIPGSQLRGVHYLRAADDSTALLAGLALKPRVAVVGGGFIGAEVASVCRQLGLDVTLIDVAHQPMADAVGDQVARYLSDRHANHGIGLRLGVGVSAFVGSDCVEGVQLSDGSVIPAEIVVIGIGVVAETGWLASSELLLDNGVVCDEYCRAVGTTQVVAAGDVARWYNPLYGVHMRVEHWTNAADQGEYAAGALLDGLAGRDPSVAFAPAPYFWSEQHGSRIQFVGVNGPDVRTLEGSLESGKCVVGYLRLGRLVGAMCINSPTLLQRYRRMILDRQTFE